MTLQEEELQELQGTFKDAQEPSIWDSDYLEDLRVLVKHYILRFFNDKLDHRCKPLTKDRLCDKKYIIQVLNTNIFTGVGKVYEALEKKRGGRDPKTDLEDIKDMLVVQRQCAQAGVPQLFSAGIIMMYYELVKGVPID